MKNILFITLLVFALSICDTSAQSEIHASKNPVSFTPLKHSLLSSSQTSNHKFYDPFMWARVNSNYDIFSYDESTKKITFSVEQLGVTNSGEKSFYLIFEGVNVRYITVQDGYTGAKSVSNKTQITKPSNSVLGAISGATNNLNNADILFNAYELGVKSWSNNIMIEVYLVDGISENFFMTAVVKNPSGYANFVNEVTDVVYAPLTTIYRLLGESNNLNMSFANYEIIIPDNKKINISHDGLLLSEDFEDNQLHSLISINKIDRYKKDPSIVSRNNFGSNYCYGFGKSICGASCFDSYATEMIVDFGRVTYIEYLTFDVMELDGDWGSSGQVYIDGIKVDDVQLGSSPSNDGKPDYKPRKITIDVKMNSTELKIRIYDITNRSEIFIDNLIIYGNKGQTANKQFSNKATIETGNDKYCYIRDIEIIEGLALITVDFVQWIDDMNEPSGYYIKNVNPKLRYFIIDSNSQLSAYSPNNGTMPEDNFNI